VISVSLNNLNNFGSTFIDIVFALRDYNDYSKYYIYCNCYIYIKQITYITIFFFKKKLEFYFDIFIYIYI